MVKELALHMHKKQKLPIVAQVFSGCVVFSRRIDGGRGAASGRPAKIPGNRAEVRGAMGRLQPTVKNPTVESIRKLMGVNDLDEKIWREELDSFVPSRLCDMHSHLTRFEFDLRPNKESEFHWTLSSAPFRRAGSIKLIDTCEAVFYPGRTVDRLVTPTPHPECDFARSNNFIAGRNGEEARRRAATDGCAPEVPLGEIGEFDRAGRSGFQALPMVLDNGRH